MRIEPGALPLGGLRSGKPRRAGGDPFDALLDPADPPAEPPQAGAAPAPLATAPLASLTAPGTPDSAAADPADDATAQAHGAELLDTLTELQIALLEGDGANPLRKLGKLAENLPRSSQPALQDALDAIAQRAAIELARANLAGA